MWWWYLGGQVEKRLGAGKLLQIALVAAFMSGWAQSLFSGSNFGGLSGVVYALMGYVWWCGERAPQMGINMPRGLMVFQCYGWWPDILIGLECRSQTVRILQA